jgi:hypothetical protein
LPVRALTGRLQADALPFLVSRSDTTADVMYWRTSVALDGEVAMLAPPLVYRIRPRAPKVMVPEAPA